MEDTYSVSVRGEYITASFEVLGGGVAGYYKGVCSRYAVHAHSECLANTYVILESSRGKKRCR